MLIRSSFLAVSFWFLIGLSGGWWLHKLFNENNLRYQTLNGENPVQESSVAAADRAIEKKQTARTEQKRNSFKQWLAEDNYQEIFLYYETLVKQGADLDTIKRTRNALLFKIKNMINENPGQALSLLEQFRQIDAYDPLALFFMAEAYLANERYLAAIDAVMGLNTFVQDEVGKEQIEALVAKAEVLYRKEIEETGHYDKMLELYEKLVGGYSDKAVYYYRLAEAQKKLNLFEDALASLSYIAYDGMWGKQARDLASVIQQLIDLEEEIKVPVERVGDHFIVTASINGIPGVRLLIDTGASLCGLRPNVANSLGVAIDYDKKAVINLAVGTTSVPMATVDLFEVGEAKLENLRINVIEMPIGIAEDGLLGMNFLGRFNWLINQEENVLYLGAK